MKRDASGNSRTEGETRVQRNRQPHRSTVIAKVARANHALLGAIVERHRCRRWHGHPSAVARSHAWAHAPTRHHPAALLAGLLSTASWTTSLHGLAVHDLITDRQQPKPADTNGQFPRQCKIHTTAEMDCVSVRNVGALVADVVEDRVGKPRRDPRPRKLEAPSHSPSGIDGDFAGTEPLGPISRWRTDCERRSKVQSGSTAPQKACHVNIAQAAR